MELSQDKEIEGLVRRIQQSDTNAFDCLYLKYYEKLFGFFFVRIRSEELAKDFVQDVFFRLWKNRINLDPAKSINAYLFRTAQHLLINHYEKKSVRERARRELLHIETTTEMSDVFDLEDHIREMIEKLPQDVRHVFLLSRMEELKYSEIAERLNFSVKKVERLMSKALKILREEYQKMTA